MKGVRAILLAALVFVALTAGAVAEDPVSSAAGVITNFSKDKITRDAVKTELSNKYAAGTLTRADLKKVVTAAYNHNLLKREDMRWLLGEMYKEGKLTRVDLKWILIEAYKNNELTRADLKFLITEAYEAGDLKREDIRILITAAYRNGELTRADVKWLIVESYKAGELTRDDLRWILLEAVKQGELRKTDVIWIIKEAYRTKELTTSDITEEEINTATIEKEPADVPSVEEITEPNAGTASEATTSETFDEESTAAPADSVIKTKQAMMLYKYALLPVEKHRIGMEAIIGYVESLGKDTSKLVTLKDKFVSLADDSIKLPRIMIIRAARA